MHRPGRAEEGLRLKRRATSLSVSSPRARSDSSTRFFANAPAAQEARARPLRAARLGRLRWRNCRSGLLDGPICCDERSVPFSMRTGMPKRPSSPPVLTTRNPEVAECPTTCYYRSKSIAQLSATGLLMRFSLLRGMPLPQQIRIGKRGTETKSAMTTARIESVERPELQRRRRFLNLA